MKKPRKKERQEREEAAGMEMTPVAMAIANIGGTMEEVAVKLGTSRSTLYRLLDKGVLDPKKTPLDLVRSFVELSGLKEEILLGQLGQSKTTQTTR